MRNTLTALCFGASIGVAAHAQVIDGQNIPTDFGAAIATQDTNTGFGNNFNELNQMFVTSDATNVFVALSGNIHDNNAIFVFIDTTPGNNPSGEVLTTEPGGGCPGSVPTVLRVASGMRFDPGFDPDFALTISVGKFPGHSDWQLVAACDVTNLTTLASTSLGIGALESDNGVLTGDSGVEISINSDNIGGVTDYCFPAQPPSCGPTVAETGSNPAEVTTGIEIKIPRSLLGNLPPNRNVSFFSYISNNAQDGGGMGPCGRSGYGSNQALPGLQGNDNLAAFTPGGTTIDFSGPQGPGTQFVTVLVP